MKISREAQEILNQANKLFSERYIMEYNGRFSRWESRDTRKNQTILADGDDVSVAKRVLKSAKASYNNPNRKHAPNQEPTRTFVTTDYELTKKINAEIKKRKEQGIEISFAEYIEECIRMRLD